MEEFEELKRKLMNKVQNKEMPEEILQIINNIYTKIMQITQGKGVSNITVEDVIYENNKLLNQRINNKIANERNENQLEELNYILKGMERDLEKIEETQLNEEQSEEINAKSHQRNIFAFEEMDMNSSKDVNRIVDSLEESVREVRNVIKRVLSSRGVSEDKVEEVEYELSRVIRDIQSKVPEELMTVLKQEDEKTIKEIIEIYEDYETFKMQKQNKDKRKEFLEELDAGIPLKEQNANSKKFCEDASIGKSNEKRENSLPDDILK